MNNKATTTITIILCIILTGCESEHTIQELTIEWATHDNPQHSLEGVILTTTLKNMANCTITRDQEDDPLQIHNTQGFSIWIGNYDNTQDHTYTLCCQKECKTNNLKKK